MSLKFRIGDKVILKKNRIKAIILLEIGDRKVKIEDEGQNKDGNSKWK